MLKWSYERADHEAFCFTFTDENIVRVEAYRGYEASALRASSYRQPVSLNECLERRHWVEPQINCPCLIVIETEAQSQLNRPLLSAPRT